MEKLVLIFKGRDDWDRPVYESNGQLYVDVNPYRNRRANIHTKCDNDFYGEPDMPIRDSLEVEFVPSRDTWDKKDIRNHSEAPTSGASTICRRNSKMKEI